MKIGFTGTKKGMSVNQKDMLRWFLDAVAFVDIHMDEFHHGDCVGADRQAKHILDQLNKVRASWKIIPHPAGDQPLVRDKHIVAIVDFLIAAPYSDKEVLRSGTWATVRYARKKGIPIVMLPRGVVKSNRRS